MLANQIRFYLITGLLGCLVGLLGTAFQVVILQVEQLVVFLSSINAYLWVFNIPLVMLMVYLAWLMVIKIAPEASGSGIQEIEAYLIHQRQIYWKRLIPVKFIAGALAIGSKMLLGREGPTIQLGGSLGAMLAEKFKFDQDFKDCLVAAGAAAGLATAFNAPLAGVLFVTEEMRRSFGFSIFRFKQILTCVVASTIMNYLVLGGAPQLVLPSLSLPNVSVVFVFFLLGVFIGLFGFIYNGFTMWVLELKEKLNFNQQRVFVLLMGAMIGTLAIIQPNYVGEGYLLIENALKTLMPLHVLLLLFVIRFILGILCYATAVPGGIFSPMLALGTLLGLMVFNIFFDRNNQLGLSPEMFAFASMGALFAATIQAPMTGILLVIELTHNYDFILPLMVSCLSACMVAQLESNPSIYSRFLQKLLNQQKLN
jgi:CIC family chloride channel protein